MQSLTAQNWLVEAETLAKKLAPDILKDANVSTPIALAWTRFDDFAKAKQTAEQIKHDSCRQDTLTKIAVAEAEKGDVLRAKQTAPYPAGLAGIALVEAARGSIADAQATLESAIKGLSRISDAYEKSQQTKITALALAKIRLIPQAIAQAESLSPTYEKAEVFAKMAAMHKGNDRTQELFAKAREYAEKIDWPLFKSFALRGISVSLAEARNYIDAKKTAREITDPSQAAIAFGEIARIQDNPADSQATLKEGEDFVRKATDVGERCKALEWIAIYHLWCGNIDEALRVVGSFPKGTNPSGRFFHELAVTYARKGESLLAIKQLTKLTEGPLVKALIDLAVVFAEQRDPLKALKMVESIPYTLYKAEALARMSFAAIK